MTPRAGRGVRIAVVLASAATVAACGSPSPGPGASPSSAPATPTAPAGVSGTSQTATPTNAGAPAAREAFAAGYDPITRTLLIQGGRLRGAGGAYNAQPPVAETWSWNGVRWRRLADGPAVAHASLTLDPTSGRLLLIGGDAPVPGQVALAQTGMWSWDGRVWTRVADNPAEGGASQAGTDPLHKQVLVSATGPTGVCPPPECTQTPAPYQNYGRYVWDGGAWRSARTDFQEVRGSTDAAMGFDPISARLIQQGGNAQAPSDATLAWNGAAWTLLRAESADPATSGPFTGTAASDGRTLVMLADPRTDDMSIASTWTFDGSRWQRHVINEPAAAARLVRDDALKSFIAVGSKPAARTLSVWRLPSLDEGWQLLPG